LPKSNSKFYENGLLKSDNYETVCIATVNDRLWQSSFIANTQTCNFNQQFVTTNFAKLINLILRLQIGIYLNNNDMKNNAMSNEHNVKYFNI